MPIIKGIPWPIEQEDRYIGELRVLQSFRGYFIGRMQMEKSTGNVDICSRETDYFETQEEADKALRDGTFEVRVCAENEWAYQTGRLPYPKAQGSMKPAEPSPEKQL